MRTMATIVAVAFLVISQLPGRVPAAAANDGYTVASADALNEIVVPAADPVCVTGTCRVVQRPMRTVVRTVVTAPVAVVRSVTTQRVYSSGVVYRSGPFMSRGPARRVAVRAARVVTAPVRWLRCR